MPDFEPRSPFDPCRFRAGSVTVEAFLDFLRTEYQGHGAIPVHVSGTGTVGNPEQAIFDRASLGRCVSALERVRTIDFVMCDELPRFAKRARMPVGAVVVGAIRRYQASGLSLTRNTKDTADIPLATPLPQLHGEGRDLAWPVERGMCRALADLYEWLCEQSPTLPAVVHDLPTLAQAFREGRGGKAKELASGIWADCLVVVSAWVDLWNARYVRRMTVREFAEKYGVPAPTVKEWCQRGKLPAEIIKGQWRIDELQLETRAEATSSELEASVRGELGITIRSDLNAV